MIQEAVSYLGLDSRYRDWGISVDLIISCTVHVLFIFIAMMVIPHVRGNLYFSANSSNILIPLKNAAYVI